MTTRREGVRVSYNAATNLLMHPEDRGRDTVKVRFTSVLEQPNLVVDGVDDLLSIPLSSEHTAQLAALYGSRVPASAMAFQNTAWDAFVQLKMCGIANNFLSTSRACTAHVSHLVLDVTGANAALYEPHDVPEGTYGRLILALTTSKKKTKPWQSCELNALSMCAMYLSVQVSSEPITDGCRVALIYHLVYDDPAPGFSIEQPSRTAAAAVLTALASIRYQAQKYGIFQIPNDDGDNDTSQKPPTSFKHIRGYALAFVNALDASGEYDYVLARATKKRCEYLARPSNAAIPPSIKASRTKTYPSRDALLLALVEAASGIDDDPDDDEDEDGFMYGFRNDDVLSTTRLKKTHEPELPAATMLQLLLDANSVDVIDEYLRHSCQNHDHPKMHHIGPKLHACLTTYGWSALGSAVQAMLQRWVATSPPEILHLPFVLLASLAGVLDDPICAPLDHPRLPEVVQAAYVALRSACDAAKALDDQRNFRGRKGDRSWDAALCTVQCSLLIEAYVRDSTLSLWWKCNTRLPPILLSMVYAYWAPNGLMAAMTEKHAVSLYHEHVLLPAIGLAVITNSRVSIAPYVPAKTRRIDWILSRSKSMTANLGNLLYHASRCNDPRDVYGVYGWYLAAFTEGGDVDDEDDRCWLLSTVCSIAKRIPILSRNLTEVATCVAKAVDCLTLRPGTLDYLVPMACDDAVPLDEKLRHEYSCRRCVADALGFFNAAKALGRCGRGRRARV
ncbi:hypothetical protein SDRG_04679 [Saprolegnia diclina VS20]|uniref:Uncharacterized protein n=1 Tax=Saprolegnia diclina (strain VS20) TaxID=1156394 RepID=T0S039_SAPDV|nr:hypothetical protein SDRG_04679 [Saprolegnia diclina VS20]EQC38253.1 hypothetical protein SDRG_04679 [Saprolegnia diclina VS20]|eukprot:XP_008608580.1 hypothetical protein SDRG_04679 [Saprolegnia diclina VS20]